MILKFLVKNMLVKSVIVSFFQPRTSQNLIIIKNTLWDTYKHTG